MSKKILIAAWVLFGSLACQSVARIEADGGFDLNVNVNDGEAGSAGNAGKAGSAGEAGAAGGSVDPDPVVGGSAGSDSAGNGGASAGSGVQHCQEGSCVPGDQITYTCEGNQVKACTCLSDGSWGEWTDCIPAFGKCVPGDIEKIPCETGGDRVRTCDENGNWDEGVCPSDNPGPSKFKPGEPCEYSDGTPDYTCSDGSVTILICGDSGFWESLSGCDFDGGGFGGSEGGSGSGSGGSGPSCECTDGPCCANCEFLGADMQCEFKTTYSCDNSSLPGKAYATDATRYCSGSSSSCTGSLEYGQKYLENSCSTGQVCLVEAGEIGYTCHQVPSDPVCTFKQSGTKACNTNNPSNKGYPSELCLEVRPKEGSPNGVFEMQICRTDSSMSSQNDYNWWLGNMNPFSLDDLKVTGFISKGSSQKCIPYQTVDLRNKITKTGPSKGMAVRGSMKPTNTSAVYEETGDITVYKECQ